MEILLTIATILGGLTALWFFGDKITDFWRWKNDKENKSQTNLSPDSSRERIEQVIMESNPENDWNHKGDGNISVTSYKNDLNLRFEMKFLDEGVQQEDFREPWANRHPDPSATGYWCNLFYGSTLVDKFVLVYVDGARAMLPIPKKGEKEQRPNLVLPLDYKVAKIHDTLGTLDEYLVRSNLNIFTAVS